jgi:AcrR family transcriptional regulator
MRGVAKAAGTTTPTVYERYHDRDDILRALRIQTRVELFSALTRTRSLTQACQRYLEYALEHPHAYEVLFDGFAQPPSLQEPWPSFNLMRSRLAQRLGGGPRNHTRLMLSLWSLMHGTAMLMIRGGVSGALRTQMIHACLDALEAVVGEAHRSKGRKFYGPRWPSDSSWEKRLTAKYLLATPILALNPRSGAVQRSNELQRGSFVLSNNPNSQIAFIWARRFLP